MTTTSTTQTPTAASTRLGRIAAATYGGVVYTLFLGVFLYAIGFVGNIGVPKSIDSGQPGPFWPAVLINACLLGLFAIQHSVMARPWFKERWTRIVPKPVERSTFVLATTIVLTLMYWQWRPLPTVVWEAESTAMVYALHGLFALGWAIVLLATFMIHHFDLFGLRQVYLYLKGNEYTHLGFRTPGFYQYVRHPIMVGFLIAFWATPTMTVGHLLFAVMTTGYILVAVQLEERDLIRFLGRQYERYKAEVPGFIPGTKPARAVTRTAASGA